MKEVKRARSRAAIITPDANLRFVLRRCAQFFYTAGYPADVLEAEWRMALDLAKRRKKNVQFYRAGPIEHYSAICERWIRDPTYLDKVGNPLLLPINGGKSISSLIKDVGVAHDARVVAAALEKIGSVTSVEGGKYALIKKMLRTRPDTLVAYETYSQFLSYAVKAATMPLRNRKSDQYSHWLMASRDDLSEAETKRFINFANRRSESQFLEIDDALNATSNRKRQRKPRRERAVGAAMFTFVMEPPAL